MRGHKQLSKRMIALQLAIRETRLSLTKQERDRYQAAVLVWEEEGGRSSRWLPALDFFIHA
ncbi:MULTISPECIES: hypothetical protein [Pandoraea]|uniref:Uncharacterized protein n=2 Tax=Pandoraea TaxID=93217 RepID=A0A5E4Y8J4_9BURK|nr:MULTISPECIES: hypothetical protein [Pandoraea]VVD61469.1 hypothetical protein PSO31014_00122 [Pandoraea soli]VVE45111.1 hypothetical protein PCE31106_04344 [Pandoraea cepalis]